MQRSIGGHFGSSVARRGRAPCLLLDLPKPAGEGKAMVGLGRLWKGGSSSDGMHQILSSLFGNRLARILSLDLCQLKSRYTFEETHLIYFLHQSLLINHLILHPHWIQHTPF